MKPPFLLCVHFCSLFLKQVKVSNIWLWRLVEGGGMVFPLISITGAGCLLRMANQRKALSVYAGLSSLDPFIYTMPGNTSLSGCDFGSIF